MYNWLHSWWCPSVKSLNFQLCDHTSRELQDSGFPEAARRLTGATPADCWSVWSPYFYVGGGATSLTHNPLSRLLRSRRDYGSSILRPCPHSRANTMVQGGPQKNPDQLTGPLQTISAGLQHSCLAGRNHNTTMPRTPKGNTDLSLLNLMRAS